MIKIISHFDLEANLHSVVRTTHPNVNVTNDYVQFMVVCDLEALRNFKKDKDVKETKNRRYIDEEENVTATRNCIIVLRPLLEKLILSSIFSVGPRHRCKLASD